MSGHAAHRALVSLRNRPLPPTTGTRSPCAGAKGRCGWGCCRWRPAWTQEPEGLLGPGLLATSVMFTRQSLGAWPWGRRSAGICLLSQAWALAGGPGGVLEEPPGQGDRPLRGSPLLASACTWQGKTRSLGPWPSKMRGNAAALLPRFLRC